MEDLQSVNRIVFDLDFVEDAFNELPYHMQQKENLVKLLIVAAKRQFSHNNEIIKLAYSMFLDNAEGFLLESIADRLFIPRLSNETNALRSAIKFRALRQDSEATRDDIVKLIQIIADDNNVKLYKNNSKYVELVFSLECLNASNTSITIPDLFPINSNLVVGDVLIGKTPFGVGSIYDTPPDNIGKLESIHTPPIDINQYISVVVYSDERNL